MRESGRVSISPNLAKLTFGHGARSSALPPPPARCGATSAPLTKLCTSPRKIRPFNPVPVTRPRSTPSSRANLRTAGLACGLCPDSPCGDAAGADGAGPLEEPSGAAAAPWADGGGSADGAAAATGAGADPGSAAAGAAALPLGAEALPADSAALPSEAGAVSITTMGDPSETLSPVLTLISLTMPASVDGTSIEALSDSMVMSESSTRTGSPGLTITSMTSTSLNSPMSGTLISTSGPIASHRRRIRLFRIDFVLLDCGRDPGGRYLLVVGERA